MEELGSGGTTDNVLIAFAAKGFCNEQRVRGTKFFPSVRKQERIGLLEQRNVRPQAFGETMLEVIPGLTQK